MAVIHKVFTKADSGGGMTFVLSDATPDRYGDIILADGWELNNFNKNPIALFGHRSDFPVGKWKNVRVSGTALLGDLELAPKGTSDRIDEIRKLIEADILRAVSVGFRPLESKPISNNSNGEIYTKQELVECSVVSVPANPNALAVAKGLGISRDTMDVIFAKHGNEVTITERAMKTINGKHALDQNSSGKKKPMSGLAKRIETAQTRIVELRDQLEKHLEGIDDANPADADTAVTETLTEQIDAQEKSLDSLKRAEASLARASAGTALATTTVANTGDRSNNTNEQLTNLRSALKPFAAPAEKVRPSDYIFKAIAVDLKHFGEGRKRPILEVLKENYGENEMVRTVMAQFVTKAAAIPADTTTSGWASNLVQTVIGDFIQTLMPLSVYPKLAAKGSSFTFGRNGTISLPGRNPGTSLAGSFVAQGAPIPVRQGAFTSMTLTPKKLGVITTMTREITEHSTPAIEAIVRQAILEDTAVAIDTVLLDNTAATAIRPAGLQQNISGAITPSVAATSIQKLIDDLKSMVAQLIANLSGNLRAPVWIMNPGDVLAIQLTQAAAGGDFPFLDELAGGTLLGWPVITSTTGLTDKMFLVDAADFLTATGDTPQFSVSDQAVLHMEDTTPAAIGTAGTPPVVATPARSLWQTDTMAIRMIMDINWAMRRAGATAFLSAPTWN
jgi:HK97 family phage major capsid protein/HK97 family phage prohead protease